MPMYWFVITYALPEAVYPFSGYGTKVPSPEETQADETILVHIVVEVFIIMGSALSACIFLLFRSVFRESFLQEEWLHA